MAPQPLASLAVSHDGRGVSLQFKTPDGTHVEIIVPLYCAEQLADSIVQHVRAMERERMRLHE